MRFLGMTVPFQLRIAYGNIMIQKLHAKSRINTMRRTRQRKWRGLYRIATMIMDGSTMLMSCKNIFRFVGITQQNWIQIQINNAELMFRSTFTANVVSWAVHAIRHKNAMRCLKPITNFIWHLKIQIVSTTLPRNYLKMRCNTMSCQLWWAHVKKTMRDMHQRIHIFTLKNLNRPKIWPNICINWIKMTNCLTNILNGVERATWNGHQNNTFVIYVPCCTTMTRCQHQSGILATMIGGMRRARAQRDDGATWMLPMPHPLGKNGWNFTYWIFQYP